MKHRIAALAGALLLCLATAACKKEADKGTGTGTAPATAAGTAAGTTAAAGSAAGTAAGTTAAAGSGSADKKDDDIPTEQDFEKKAAKQINKKNLAKELKKIESAVGK